MPPVGRGRSSKPRRKKRAPSKTHLSHVQARQYGSPSQSRRAAQVNRRTYHPPPARRPIAFRPIRQTNAPFRVERQRQHRQTRRAERKIGDSPAVPHVPLLRHYTPKQRQIIRKTYKRAAKRAGTNPQGLYLLGSTSQRRQMTQVTRRVHESETGVAQMREQPKFWQNALGNIDRVTHMWHDPTQDRAPNREYHSPPARHAGVLGQLATLFGSMSPEATVRAGVAARHAGKGISGDPILHGLESTGATGVGLVRATAEDPSAVAKSSLRTARESIAGIPQGVKMIVDDPEAALNAMVDDYKKRYGTALDNPKKFREMVKRDYGLTPYALDALAFTGGAGQAAGAIARGSAFARLTRLPGQAGRAARILHEASMAERARPRLRFSAGEEGTRAQNVSRNLLVALGQRRLDRSRAAAYSRAVHRAGFIEEPHGRMLRRPGVSQSDLPGLRPGPGEVVSGGRLDISRIRDTGPLRGLTGRIARDIGGSKSVTRLQMLTHRGRVTQEVDKKFDKLSEPEKVGLAFMLKYGARAGRESLPVLEERLKKIASRELRKARREGGFSDAEMEALQQIVADPEKFLTADAKAVSNDLLEIQKREVVNDPSLANEQELVRRYSQQGALLDVPRTLDNGEKAPDVREVKRSWMMAEDLAEQQRVSKVYKFGTKTVHFQKHANEWKKMVDKLEAEGKGLGKETTGPHLEFKPNSKPFRLNKKTHFTQGRGSIDKDGVLHTWFEDEGTHLERGFGDQRTSADFMIRPDGTISVHGGGLDMNDIEVIARAMAQDPRLKPPKDLNPNERPSDGTREYPSLNEEIARVRPEYETGPRRADVSAEKPFVERVQKAARDAKLDEPAYWMSMVEDRSGARLSTAGTGLKATERNKQYKGGYFGIGAENVSMDVFRRGIERNVKRRFQWSMVAHNIDKHAYEWSRNKGRGMTFSQIGNELRKRAIDPDSVDMIPATIVQRRPDVEAGIQRGKLVEPLPEGEEFLPVYDEIKKRQSFTTLSHDEVQSAPMFKYFVVPKEVGDVLEAATQPSGATARTLEIVLKQKPTRIMLGALNVPWLGFQVLSNGILTGLGGAKPWDAIGAYRWWKSLDPEQREAIDAELGVTHGHHFALDNPQLGEARKDLPPGVRHLTAGYQAFKQTKVMRAAHKANPLDAMFKMDEAQNNFWRRTLFYSQAKKDAYRAMGRNWAGITKAQDDIVSKVFRLPAHEQVRAIAENAEQFQRHAQHVSDWLGNYTKFSNSERKLLSAHVLFYGYLRFSLRFAFYTMPIQHPIMADIIGNIGRLGAQDIKDLFGVPANYGLPASMLAQTYFGNRQDAKRGTLESLNFGRMNPFLNAVTQMESMQQGIGLVSPIYQALLDQAFNTSSFTGRQWRIKGQPTPGEAERPKNYFGSPMTLLNPGAYAIPGLTEGKPRNRILQEQLLTMAFPYRLAESTGIPGTGVEPLAPSQSDDALLWSPRAMRYKDEVASAGVARQRRAQGNKGLSDLLLQGLALQPRVTAAPAVIKREREKEAEQAKRKKKGKRRSGGSSYGGGGGYGGGYGGSGGYGG